MNCEDVEQKIPLLCGSDLPPEENRERLLDHINRCDSCRNTLMEYRESREVLQHVKEEGMPDEFWTSFQQDLDAKLAELPSPSRGSTSPDKPGEPITAPSSSLRTALVAAAMLLFGLGLGFFGKPLIPEYGSDETTPAESVSPAPSTPSERTSDDLATEDARSIEDRPDSRSVYNGRKKNEQHDIYKEEPILSNPIHDLKPEDRHDVQSSD